MASGEIAGKLGAVYWRPRLLEKITISFVDSNADTILDSASGFVTAGFVAGNVYTVSGSTVNDGNYTVDTVLAGTLTLDSGATLTAEAAGDTVTITAALPGVVLTQFYNWSLTTSVDVQDVTDYANSGIAHYIPGIQRWTATAEKFWNTSEVNEQTWKATDKFIRFFMEYNATPTVTTVYYLEGTGLVDGLVINAPVDAVVTQSMTLTGNGALPVGITRTTAWPTQ